MKKIVLLCNAGMSTSMLVTKMKKEAEIQKIECEIAAFPVMRVEQEASDADIILIGPQIQYELENIKNKMSGKIVDVIDMKDYGMMNGKNVLEKAIALMDKK